MKEQILKLRNEGKSYNEIKNILGCSKGTISYHCGEGQKEKTALRQKSLKKNIVLTKLSRFRYAAHKNNKKPKGHTRLQKNINESLRCFQKKDNLYKTSNKTNPKLPFTFTWQEVVDKFGEDTNCYLSGEKINLFINNYHFDHIIPTSRGGNNSFDNLGILHETVNFMKHSLTPEELIEWCKKILIYNGYIIK